MSLRLAAVLGARISVPRAAASHTPTIGFAYDQNKQDDSDWAPIFRVFEPVPDWFERMKRDAIVCIFNDHVTSFCCDHYSAFTGTRPPKLPPGEPGLRRA